MPIKLHGFARPVDKADLKPGDLFLATSWNSVALAMRAEIGDAQLAVVLREEGRSYTETIPQIVNLEAIGDYVAVVDQDVLAMPEGGLVTLPAEEMRIGCLLLPEDTPPLILVRNTHRRVAISLTGKHYQEPARCSFVYSRWQLEWRDGDRTEVLARFEPPVKPRQQ